MTERNGPTDAPRARDPTSSTLSSGPEASGSSHRAAPRNLRGPALATRREKVARLLAQAKTEREIAHELGNGISRDSVHRDIVAIRPALLKASEQAVGDVYADAVAEFHEIRRKLWEKYEKCPAGQTGLAVAILMDIASLWDRRVRLGQTMGLVTQAPERIEVVQQFQRDLADMAMRDPEAERVLRRLALP